MTPDPFTVEPGAASQRLDVYLATRTQRPRSQIQRLIQAGLAPVNGQVERPSYQVAAGDKILLGEQPEPEQAGAAPELVIVYEDTNILVVDKPAGIAVHPGAGLRPSTTVADFARPRTTDADPERPGIVHRLDRDTSGLLIIAKNVTAKAFMQAAFKARQVHKTYSLLTVGRVKPEFATIRLPLGRDPAHPLQQAVVADGREAVTAYKTVSTFPGFTLIEAQPETGRTHQLRAHFAALGHPVAGDTVYGPPKRPLNLKRQFLHATTLEFTAPSGKQLRLQSPLPPDLTVVLNRLNAAVPS
jgi:23S rRNA pseudouridine1911/1915/1917 synthase